MLRVRPFSLAILFFLSLSYAAHAQQWNGLLASDRAIDWSSAGAGTIPDRTTICSTLGAANQSASASQSVTAAQINSALQTCANSNGVVYLNAGTYNLSGSINAAPNVTLRGAGPGQTNLNFSGSLGNLLGTGPVAVGIGNGDSHSLGNANNILAVTGGLTKGSTSVTLGTATAGSISNLKVGSIMIFNQLDDASDTGNAYFCGTAGGCSQQSDSGTVYPGRSQSQGVIVTAINGSTVTFTPGIYAPNWSQNKSPLVTFSSLLPLTGFGLEALTVNTSAASVSGQPAAIQSVWAAYSWIRNVTVINNTGAGSSFWAHVWFTSSVHMEVRDSYLYGSSPTMGGYGVLNWQSYDTLTENNICQTIATCTIQDSGAGNVYGYNYAVDNAYVGSGGTSPHWQQCDQFHHNAGDYYNLWEGNIGTCHTDDSIHGTSFANTVFRNALSGFDPTTVNPKTQNLLAINDMAYARYNNYVANVLGYGKPALYQYIMSSANDCGPGSPGLSTALIWAFDDSGQTIQAANSSCGSSYNVNNDVVAGARPSQSSMRWGNWDAVTGAVKTSSAEAGSSANTYPALSSPSTSWSSFPSLYLPAKPSWWVFPSGTTAPWPGIGPEVTGGNIPGTSGHAYLNPAANCYLNVLGAKTDGTSGQQSFDGDTCYPTSATAGGPPPPPSNLTGTAQ